MITSADRMFLEQIQSALGHIGTIRQKRSGYGSVGYDYILARVLLYQRLLAIGLTPRKSLTLGPLMVPGHGFPDVLRGVIDGDGNIRRWQHPTNGREQWTVRIYGGSKRLLEWVQNTVKRRWGVTGKIHHNARPTPEHHPRFALKYGKIAAKVILAECYYPKAFALERKRRLAFACIGASVGWSKSKTVTDARRWQHWTYNHAHPKNTSASSNIADGHVFSCAEYVCDSAADDYAGVGEWQTRDP